MKSLAILLFMLVIRYSSAGYMRTYSEGGYGFDMYNCYSSNKTILDLMEATAGLMDRLVGYLEKDQPVPTSFLDEYKAAVALERKTARKFIYDWEEKRVGLCRPARSIAGNYATLLDWDSSNRSIAVNHHFRHLVERHEKFFHTPSATLDKYYAMKLKEKDTWGNFFHNGGEDIYDKPTENPFGGGESAEAGFECPKKKRQSAGYGAAVASKMNAPPQLFVIFLCIVIGIFVVLPLQPWLEKIGELEELRSNEEGALTKVQRCFPREEEGWFLGSSVEMRIDCNLPSRVE